MLFKEVRLPCYIQHLPRCCHHLHRSHWTVVPVYSNSTWSGTPSTYKPCYKLFIETQIYELCCCFVYFSPWRYQLTTWEHQVPEARCGELQLNTSNSWREQMDTLKQKQGVRMESVCEQCVLTNGLIKQYSASLCRSLVLWFCSML